MLISDRLLVVFALAIAVFNTGTAKYPPHISLKCFQYTDIEVTDEKQVQEANSKRPQDCDLPESNTTVLGENGYYPNIHTHCFIITMKKNNKDMATAGCWPLFFAKYDPKGKFQILILSDWLSSFINGKECMDYFHLRSHPENILFPVKRILIDIERYKNNGNNTFNYTFTPFTIKEACFSEQSHMDKAEPVKQFPIKNNMCNQYQMFDDKPESETSSKIGNDSCHTSMDDYYETDPTCYYAAFQTKEGKTNLTGGCLKTASVCTSVGIFFRGCIDDPDTIKHFFGDTLGEQTPLLLCCCKGEKCNKDFAPVKTQCHQYNNVDKTSPAEVAKANDQPLCYGEFCFQFEMNDELGRHFATAGCLDKEYYNKLELEEDMDKKPKKVDDDVTAECEKYHDDKDKKDKDIMKAKSKAAILNVDFGNLTPKSLCVSKTDDYKAKTEDTTTTTTKAPTTNGATTSTSSLVLLAVAALLAARRFHSGI